ncbi:MAG: DUF2283 domain-containing protein [Planctomycetota bacterium]
MEKVRVYYDGTGKTLTVWFGDPQSEDVCEEADDDTILMKDAHGRIIGFEKLNVPLAPGVKGITVEVVALPGEAA